MSDKHSNTTVFGIINQTVEETLAMKPILNPKYVGYADILDNKAALNKKILSVSLRVTCIIIIQFVYNLHV